MPRARFLSFDGLDGFEATFRTGHFELLEPTRIDFTTGLLTHGSARTTSSTVRSGTRPARVRVMFLADTAHAVPLQNGMKLSAQELVVRPPRAIDDLRAPESSRLAMMSLAADDLAAADRAIGPDLTGPSNTLVHPAPEALTRLRTLYNAACRLATRDPDAFARPAIAQSVKHQLVRALVECLARDTSRGPVRDRRSHARIIARFEEFLATRRFEPVYLAQICAAIGTPERTLRTCCQEHLGMGPIHYHWLRRMNLARRALVDRDPARTTVTEIATKYGFSELGRFSVEYRALFGESPSASLRRRSHDKA
jgi:AraC-like DNA-binding protein